ncbi:MAG: putative toxin-antitoxin system toxin component, PIN family [bacterium]
MEKIVVDTNVFVSSFLGGKPREVIDHWIEGRVTLCLSADILDEYVRVFEELDFIEDEYVEILSLLEEQYNLVFADVTPDIEVIEDDPADDKFLECAVKLDADTIVTGDEDLLALDQYGTITIQSPTQFLSAV